MEWLLSFHGIRTGGLIADRVFKELEQAWPSAELLGDALHSRASEVGTKIEHQRAGVGQGSASPLRGAFRRLRGRQREGRSE